FAFSSRLRAFAFSAPSLEHAPHHLYSATMRFTNLLAFLLTLIALSASSTAQTNRPNVLFILCDDIRWDCLSFAGHPYLKTPNSAPLPAEGVHFKNMFCTTSLCSPSRASILSGVYAHTHGVTNNFTEFPNSLPGFHTRLHESGYTTAYMGKWHMGEE